jgi:hypothetical protein
MITKPVENKLFRLTTRVCRASIYRHSLIWICYNGRDGGSLALGRLVTGMVFGLKPGDPRVLLAATAVLAAVAAIAAWFPARRAALMDPTVALRHE